MQICKVLTLITKVQSDRGCTATLVFFALSSMTDLPRSAASCENGRLSNKEDIACVTSARSHVTSEKLAKKCKKWCQAAGGGGVQSPKNQAFSKGQCHETSAIGDAVYRLYSSQASERPSICLHYCIIRTTKDLRPCNSLAHLSCCYLV